MSIFDSLPENTLGQRIRKARLEQRLLQKDLAIKLGVTETTIANWEQERNKPIGAYAKRLGGYLKAVFQ